MDVEELVKEIMDCCVLVRKQLVPGYEEKVYTNALAIELNLHNMDFQSEVPVKVLYNGLCVGDYRCDFIVENRIILELKATACLTPANEVQLVNYLTATGIDDGLLINFGSEKIQFRRKYRIYKPKDSNRHLY